MRSRLTIKNTHFTLHEILGRLQDGISRLESWGIHPPPGSRLPIYLDRLRAAFDAPDNVVSPELGTQLQFHFRDVDDFVDILESFSSPPQGTELRRLRTALGDDEHPDRGSSTKARDAQYELKLRAVFQQAGMDVEMVEPDLVLHAGDLRIPVAAKRIQSAKGFEDRLRSGLRQLQRHPDEGIVAICLDQAIRPRNKWLQVPNKNRLAPRVEEEMKAFLSPRIRLVRTRMASKHTAGVLLSLSLPSHSLEEGYMGSGHNWQFLPGKPLSDGLSPAAAEVWKAVQAFP